MLLQLLEFSIVDQLKFKMADHVMWCKDFNEEYEGYIDFWTYSFHFDHIFEIESRLRSLFEQKCDFHKITKVTRQNFEIQKNFSHENRDELRYFDYQHDAGHMKIICFRLKLVMKKFKFKGKFQKKNSLRSSTALSDFWPKPIYSARSMSKCSHHIRM